MQKAQLELAEEFNNCPGKENFEAKLQSLGIELEYVDMDEHTYWVNDDATVVCTITKAGPENFGEFIWSIGPDEFQTKLVDGKIVLRLWWD